MSYNPYGTMSPSHYEDDKETWLVKENEPVEVLNKKDFSYQSMTFNEIQRKHRRKMNEINEPTEVEPWAQYEVYKLFNEHLEELNEELNEVVDKFIIWPRKIEGRWCFFETVECERKWISGCYDIPGSYKVIEYRKKWKLKDKYIELEN